MPGPVHVTVLSSSMSHWIDDTLAVAVTVTPPAVAEADAGPNVVGPCSTHIHIGIPTTYRPPGFGEATAGPTSRMESTARRATSSGSIVGAAGLPPFGTNTTQMRSVAGHSTW